MLHDVEPSVSTPVYREAYFDDARNSVHSSATPGTHVRSSACRRRALSPSSTSRIHAILNRFSSLFPRSQPNADSESIELPHNPGPSISQHQHSRNSPRPVEIAAVCDKQLSYVAQRPELVANE
ncbi:hypothetical protein K503DRAFT_773932 [Rhizopogon vinicolor AM-OR11-026]|uniref:Uncharacterized protein n=1 Tax=Rhizopogon vinicolor AM-OR11-026 TaxID=1314800 RepID=A0A1B7MR14_9AGAM|nr:hypothetical protein K503DRAFT_773932 [Rhizopogon vinicolor AM-OR11-026]